MRPELLGALVALSGALGALWRSVPLRARGAFVGAVAAAALALQCASRRRWEDDVRRAVWLADRARGGALDRGADWLVAGALLALAGALAAWSGTTWAERGARVAWACGASLGLLALAACAWATRG